MILSFSRTFPWKEKTEFVRKIQEGIKQHTFRIGHRWKVGMKIHFWDQNPRSTMMMPKPKPFNVKVSRSNGWFENGKTKFVNDVNEYAFPTMLVSQKEAVPVVSHIENWEMNLSYDVHNQLIFQLRIEDQSVSYIQNHIYSSTCPSFFLEDVAKRDGFDSPEDFIRWFAWDLTINKNINSLSMEGQIIHWTNKTYTK